MGSSSHTGVWGLLAAALCATACGDGGRATRAGSSDVDYLDTTFGTGGIVQVDWGSVDDTPARLVLLDDGACLVGGYRDAGAATLEMVLARYTSDGASDTGYGVGGFASPLLNRVVDLALDALGRVVVVDASYNVARYTSEGAADATFGVDGVAAPPTSIAGASTALRIHPADGSVIVAGEQAVVRYTADGAADLLFGDGGVVSIGAVLRGRALALDAQGDLLVAGALDRGAVEDAAFEVDYDFAVAKLSGGDGALDTGFGAAGLVTVPSAGSSDWASAIEALGDGSILVGGTSFVDEDTFSLVLLKYSPSGVRDATFGASGGAGSARLPWTYYVDTPVALDVADDGKIVVAARGHAFDVGRFNADGTPDRDFGDDGVVSSALVTLLGIEGVRPNSDWSQAYDVVAQPGGKVLAVGTVVSAEDAQGGVATDVALVRLLGDGP